MFNIIPLIITLVVVIALFALQYFICKKEMWFFGMILPTIFFVFSILGLVSNLIKAFEIQVSIGAIIASCAVFIIANIPTVVFLTILLNFKKKNKQQQELSNTKIADL